MTSAVFPSTATASCRSRPYFRSRPQGASSRGISMAIATFNTVNDGLKPGAQSEIEQDGICCDADEARQCVRVSLEVCFDASPLEPAAELRSLDILSGGRVNAQAIFATVCRVKFSRRLSSTRINFPESGCDPRRGLSG